MIKAFDSYLAGELEMKSWVVYAIVVPTQTESLFRFPSSVIYIQAPRYPGMRWK
jgi:hypothetical protein